MKQEKKKLPKMRRLLTLMLTALGIFLISPTTTHAAGWVGYAKNLTLGETVSGSMKAGDYKGKFSVNSNTYYWHIYKFTMPEQGRLSVYVESAANYYFGSSNSASKYGVYYTIYPASNPDDYIWNVYLGNEQYSSARERYYESTGVTLDKGEYYFAVRSKNTRDEPYYLTLSYQKPVVNVTSITLDPSSVNLEVGDQRAINADILPTNATNKALVWESSDPSVATVQNGVVEAVSVGHTSITASSSDGEISSSCAVTVACRHNYQTTVTPADRKNAGSIARKCLKCGNQDTETINAVGSVGLAKKIYVYNGEAHYPAVIVKDNSGSDLRTGIDYTVSYPKDARNVGKYTVTITFNGNYRGTAKKNFSIIPKATSISRIIPQKRGFAIKWKKQSSQTSGYEIIYSTGSNFAKNDTRTITAGKNKTSSKSGAKLQSKRTYYVRIRTYKTVQNSGVSGKVYSKWSKVKVVTTK